MSDPGDGNPYRPTVAAVAEPLEDVATEVTFRVTRGTLRHAVDHYLLRYLTFRLASVSIVLIGLSGLAITWSATVSRPLSLVVTAACLAITTAVYLGMTRSAKRKMRQRFGRLGLRENIFASVRIDDDDFVLQVDDDVHRWPIAKVQNLRTHSGMLLSPEPLVAIFVPRRNESHPTTFQTLRSRLTSG